MAADNPPGSPDWFSLEAVGNRVIITCANDEMAADLAKQMDVFMRTALLILEIDADGR